MGPPSTGRGIVIGVLLGAILWGVIVALGDVIWRWIIG